MNPGWQELRIHHHEENKDPLILELIRPLVGWLEPQVRQVFFVRHWLRGPHLSLRYLGEETRLDRLRPQLEAQVSAYLARHPSRTTLDESALLPIHRRLAHDEMETRDLTPFYPNNSWHFAVYDRRLHVMSDGIARLIEAFHAQTNDLVFDMLEHLRSGRNRVDLALDVMIATLQAVTPDIVSRFVSYHSHAEVFIVNTRDDSATRAHFERQYEQNAGALSARLHRILEGLATNQDSVPFLKRWTALMTQYTAHIEAGVVSGDIAFEPYRADAPRTAAYLEGEARLRKSRFHAMQLDDRANIEARSQDAGFNTFRMLVNLQYLLLNRIGLRPFERSLLAYLISNAVEAYFQVSAFELARTHTYTRALVGDAA
jgi:Lantibiotic biosynthesis dehydratase C-term